MSTPDNGSPAFPSEIRHNKKGMTVRTYAAIHLRVPSSEHEFINDMIRERLRDDAAIAAMQASLTGGGIPDIDLTNPTSFYMVADVVLKERES